MAKTCSTSERGIFITFEGSEGSGKSTHQRLLAERLRALGREVVETREPGGTPLGETLRGLVQHNIGAAEPVVRAELLLFCASRAQLVEQVIVPALERGAWVLCDRFTDSTLAYQGYGRGLDLQILRELNHFATAGLYPDLTLLLDLDNEESQRRLSLRRHNNSASGSDRFEREAAPFHLRLRHGFLTLAAAQPERMKVVASDRPCKAVAADIWQLVSAHFDKKMTEEATHAH